MIVVIESRHHSKLRPLSSGRKYKVGIDGYKLSEDSTSHSGLEGRERSPKNSQVYQSRSIWSGLLYDIYILSSGSSLFLLNSFVDLLATPPHFCSLLSQQTRIRLARSHQTHPLSVFIHKQNRIQIQPQVFCISLSHTINLKSFYHNLRNESNVDDTIDRPLEDRKKKFYQKTQRPVANVNLSRHLCLLRRFSWASRPDDSEQKVTCRTLNSTSSATYSEEKNRELSASPKIDAEEERELNNAWSKLSDDP